LDRQHQTKHHKAKLLKIILLTINHPILYINLFQYNNLSLSCEILSIVDNVRSCHRVASTQIATTITNTTAITLALLPDITVGIIIIIINVVVVS
jgi:hypothetical protein